MWADSHCHIPYEGVGAAAIDDGPSGGRDPDDHRRHHAAESAAGVEIARAHDGSVGHGRPASPRRVEGVDGVVPPAGRSRPGGGRRSASAASTTTTTTRPEPVQREAFAAQIGLAAELDLTLVVHTREAWDDTFDILASEGPPARWVLHCFTGGPAEAERGLEMGAMLSFSGIVTFKSADDVRAAAVACPLDRLLVETDSPYLAPVPYRGRPNSPALVPVVGAAVAAVRGDGPGGRSRKPPGPTRQRCSVCRRAGRVAGG